MERQNKTKNSPSGHLLMTPVEEKTERVKMKKELGLLEGVAIILGIIFGSGMHLFRTQV